MEQLDMNITEKAYEIYQEHGQDGVYEFVRGLPFDLPHHYCQPCEYPSPFHNGACLVCGSVIE